MRAAQTKAHLCFVVGRTRRDMHVQLLVLGRVGLAVAARAPPCAGAAEETKTVSKRRHWALGTEEARVWAPTRERPTRLEHARASGLECEKPPWGDLIHNKIIIMYK